ncbi:MAG TPA: hypothetical protein PKG54_06100 [Phycisphaerae bacterium]|jgi:hypothetical protein|nr:hypothetical protein [Phycisphaerae bacterium]HOB74082.1 hypothetical protein [Phycisphaerae bacterium]HOJ56752.1 hypothetical protein [Phycisphaerae bacterium]HOL25392.1 hypothetical protein [Phycisphaerae bacterium]HPP22068.1 hypothetical protein [Phycisphaerae bacterium]
MTTQSKDFAIGVLSVTAVVLFTALVIMGRMSPQPALALGQGGTTGDYVVSTARVDNLTEAVFIVDTLAQEMNMYAFAPLRGTIELVQKFDLRALELANQPEGPQGGDNAGDGRRGRRNR